ncbi:unnamed protein product [Discosporangium mesarthrocarpum]
MKQLYYVNTEGSGVCVDGCPSTTDTSVVICRDDRPDELVDDAAAVASGYCMYQLESSDTVNYCVLKNSTQWSSFQETDLASYATEFIADMVTAREYIFGFGFCVAILLGFVYMYFMRLPYLVAALVYSCILIVLVALLGLGYGFYATGERWNEEGTRDESFITGAYVFSGIAWVLAFLWTCFICFMRKRIELAIGVIKEAGRVITSMPLIVLWPLLQLVGFVLFMLVWAYYVAYTASLGEFKVVDNTVPGAGGAIPVFDLARKEYSFSEDVEYRLWFLLFCFFWTLNFIGAIGEIVVALSSSTWYFAREKSSVGSGTVIKSISLAMFFHMGTAAFGSLIIAIMQIIEMILSYIHKKAKASQNKVAEVVSCCCMCCFWCLENCMRFINRNAYVQTAIFSTNFCTSAKKAFWLIARNLARVGAVTILSEFVLIIMTMFVSLISAALSYWYMANHIQSDLHTLAGPTLLVVVIAFLTAKLFTEVYGTAITTILQCFIADEEMFPPSQRYAQHDLREWVDQHGGGVSEVRYPQRM